MLYICHCTSKIVVYPSTAIKLDYSSEQRLQQINNTEVCFVYIR